MRASRSLSRTMRSASCAVTSLSLPPAIVSASTAERADRRAQLVADVGDEVAPHALDPAGLGDVAHERDRAARCAVLGQREGAELQGLARRAEQDQLAFDGVAEQRLVEQVADRLLGDRVGVTRTREPARSGVAHEYPALDVDDHDAVGHRVQRGGEPVAVDVQALGVDAELGEHRVGALPRHGRRSLVAGLGERRDAPVEPARGDEHRAEQHERADRRRRSRVRSSPPPGSSSEPAGDIALGPRIARVREDHVGPVVLDEPAAPVPVDDLGGEEAGAVGDARAACCMLWVTITIVYSTLQLGHEVLDARGRDRVERGAGLVHEDHVGLHRDRARDAEPLLLTAGERKRGSS